MRQENINVHDVNFIGEYSVHYFVKTNIYCDVFDFSCSFDCFKKHKNADCTSAKKESQEKCVEAEARKQILQFTTEDTIDPEKLAQLGIISIENIFLIMSKK